MLKRRLGIIGELLFARTESVQPVSGVERSSVTVRASKVSVT
jgi:hypothetical protein